jgi:hypothetical protein
MMSSRDSLRDLLALCPPPSGGLVGTSLALVEEDLGCRLPEDYHDLMAAYGPGCFDEFLWVFGCHPENRNLDIRNRTEKARRVFSRSASVNLNLLLTNHGATRQDVVSWGGTDNGDLCIWIAVGSPSQWPVVVVDAREDSYLMHRKTVSEFLLAILRGEIRSEIFPGDFPSETPEFSVNPYGSA